MLLALFADIHSNLEAYEACRAEALRLGAEKFVYLGDLVGYGADPGAIVDRVAADAAQGAICITGNHDLAAVDGDNDYMNEAARIAIEWTSDRLSSAQLAFLAGLPFTAVSVSETGTRALFVHADASAPQRFIYITGPDKAARSLAATSAEITFCGHVHLPRLYHAAPGEAPQVFPLAAGVATPLTRGRKFLATLGSVGQPRDGDRNAAFALYDDARGSLTVIRVPYDIETAATKIAAAGLPDILARRLFAGR